MTVKMNDTVTVRFPNGDECTGVVMSMDDAVNSFINIDLGGRFETVYIAQLVGDVRGVKCGNHDSDRMYHANAVEVRTCYATHVSAKRDARTDKTPRGWWDLPIAAGMWRADALR